MAFNGDMRRTRPRSVAAASNSMVRTRASPPLVIRPTMSVFPDCHRQPVETFCRVSFGLQHFLKGDLMGGVIKGQALKP